MIADSSKSMVGMRLGKDAPEVKMGCQAAPSFVVPQDVCS